MKSSLRLLLTPAIALAVANCSQPLSAVQKETPSATTQSTAGTLDVVSGGPAKGIVSKSLETVALFGGSAMPAGVTVSKQGRIFLSFPRWADTVTYTAVELVDGALLPFPNAAINKFDAADPEKYEAAKQLVSVQSLVIDEKDRLWLLDPGSINFAPHLNNGPKLICYDINTNKEVKRIGFPNDVALKSTYLNDIRFDLSRGTEGTAYITDSGVGGIIVVDIASGKSWRKLDGDPSVLSEIALHQTTEGSEFMQRKPSGESAAPDFRSDGIALSSDKKMLYYTPVTSRKIYAVPTALLADANAKPEDIAKAVKIITNKSSGNDGILTGSDGAIYSTDFEDSAIRKTNPKTGEVTTVVQDSRLIWPDTLAEHDGWLYIVSNQLARQANYHFGKDERKAPYALFRVKIK